ncbi:MAG: acetyltransferase [Kiritimatiellae bacterium]|nr:acetyltransferase [Kiritimatiellia bacterium]
MRDLFIVGAGGFGREAIWTVERINSLSQQPAWRILGYADNDPKWKKGQNFEGYPILGTLDEADRDYPGASVFIALGNNKKRAEAYKRLRGHDFPAIIDPKAQISPTTEFKHGNFIGAGAVIQVGSELGKFDIVGSNAVIGHDAVLGDFVNMGPGTVIAGGSKVGNGVSFYANSATMPRVTIGDGATISAGTGVKSDLAAGESI